MLFSSFEFLFRFLPVFLVIYYLTPKKFRNVTLLGGSIVFYTIGEAGYITILLACVLVNYTLTRLMYRKSTDGRGIRQKRLLLLALGYDLGVLFFFKYSGLASGLPLGISFYTFQIMAYVIDVYRGRIPAEQSLLRLGTYLTMFPQLISGPITNYADVRVASLSPRPYIPRIFLSSSFFSFSAFYLILSTDHTWRTILYILISGTEIRPDFRAFHDLRGGKTTASDCSRYRCPSLPDALFARPPPEK